ncbi:precorrin-6A/cobalt-precorrin-6A reductase, partial [Mameliella alba]
MFPFPGGLFYGEAMTGIVIIGGAAEAHELARALPGAHVRLPTRERVARRWPGPVSLGPVTADWLRDSGARVVVEAGHPCDVETAFAVARAARAAGLPLLQLVRPEWRPTRRDRWVALRDVRA